MQLTFNNLFQRRNSYSYFLNTFIFLIGSVLQSFGQIPPDYYQSTQGFSSASLKSELNNIIDAHREYQYTNGDTSVWDILRAADFVKGDPSNVSLIYTGWEINGALEYNSGAGWTREHVWAKKHGEFGTAKGAGTDCHNLRPADVSVNSKKNTRWFDNCSTPYIDASGYFEGNGETGCNFDNTNWKWEPRDEVKGDVARCMFYMATRYEGENGEVDLELVDYFPSINNDPAPIHAKLSTLLEWHKQDPPSEYELRRHNIVSEYQNNRNPFIDYPDFVCRIWGGDCGNQVLISEYIEGSSYNKAIEIFNGTSSTIELSEYTIKKQTNGTGNWSSGFILNGQLESGMTYVIAHSNAGSEITIYADTLTSNTSMNFNGNDPVGLFDANDSLLDIVGVFDAGNVLFAQNVSLVRKKHILNSNSIFSENEWESFGNNDFTYLGTHEGLTELEASTLFISEYIEGSSYNKAIEIFNGTSASQDLSDFSLRKQTNGTGNWSSGISLTGNLGSQSTFVVAHSKANNEIAITADLLTTNSTMSFTGNDPIGLFQGNKLIDIIGDFDAGNIDFAKNITMIRNANIIDPNMVYTTSEWTVFAADFSQDLGVHFLSAGRRSVSVQEYYTEAKVINSLDVNTYPNPFNNQIELDFSSEGFSNLTTIIIYNSVGKIMYSSTGHIEPVSHFKINTTNYAPGVYVVRVNDGDLTVTKKILKF